MQRLVILAAVLSLVLVVVGCTEKSPASVLHPPEWIHGTWSMFEDIEHPTFMFTSRRASLASLGIDDKTLNRVGASSWTTQEVVTESRYVIRISEGESSSEIEFERLNDTEVLVTIDGGDPFDPFHLFWIGECEFSVKELVEAYEENEIAADRRFRGYLLNVSGDVKLIGHDSITLCEDKGGRRCVRCYFPDEQRSELARLSKGQYVWVTGTCDGKIVDVVMRGCSLD